MRRRLAALAVATACALLPLAPGPAAATSVTCASSPAPLTDEQREQAWQVAATRLAALAERPGYPFGATGRSRYLRTNAYSWTSGFFPSSLWLMYAHTHDPAWLTRARTFTRGVLPVARWTGTHDLGFMVGLPATLGLAADPSAERQEAYAMAVVTASRSLSKRWNPSVGAIKSSDYNGRWGLIIDSAMNAPLLLEASRILGSAEGQRLRARGLEHMTTLADHLVRADGSTFHRMSFNARTGEPLGPVYGQGLGTRSTWSRGQAWAVNGFARAFGLSGDQRMLETARRTADFWISRVPAGCVPAWDLDVTSDSAPRDSSAAAIAADGLLTLAALDPDASRATAYRAYALTTLGALTSAPWMTSGPNGRGLLQRQAYNIPADAREGTYAWGDAYLLSALAAADR